MNGKFRLAQLAFASLFAIATALPMQAHAQEVDRVTYLRHTLGGGPAADTNPIAAAVIGGASTPLACRRLVRRPASCDEISPSRRPIVAVAIAIVWGLSFRNWWRDWR